MRNYKRIPMENVSNMRDLGGYGCVDGGFIKFHCLYRSDMPSNLTTEEWKKLSDMGIRTIVNLCSSAEREAAPYTAPVEMTVHNISLMNEKFEPSDISKLSENATKAFGRSLTVGYTNMLTNGTERIAAVITKISEGLEKGSVLFHCAGGKDRTGVISAVLYSICGVADEDIIADYQVTETYIGGKFTHYNIPSEMKHLMNSNPENMRAFLTKLKEQDYISLLKDNGLTQEKIDKLKSYVIEYEV